MDHQVSSSTNSMDTASVQAKMSLDLIVEQLKREMSLKDMEDDQEQRIVLTNSTTMDEDDDDAVGPKDFFPIVFEEEITKKEETMTDPIEGGQMLWKGGRKVVRAYSINDSGGIKDDTNYSEKKEDKTNPSKMSKCRKLEEKNLTKNRMEKDEDVVELPWTFAEGRKINEEENTLAEEKEDGEKESKDGVTQTERAYTIRVAKSCPLRKRRIYRGVVSDARNKAELLGRIHRKASDNLIYEKGKASGSPSYVPLTERFRWRYVGASKAR
ncbi:hypothetical protein M0804_006589 [Polistes exclamans]|nr:hypothetical protein M0804_006589 [Polistes exclamans]